MAYNLEQHKNRVALRSDLTLLLTHLTRARAAIKPEPLLDEPGKPSASALDVLMEILEAQKIRGSNADGYIIGNKKAVCFQDIPLYSLGQMFYQEKLVKEKERPNVPSDDGTNRTDFRYTLHGLSFFKKYVWDKGGRPVFYEESKKAKTLLPKAQHWRIVDIDYNDLKAITDWTHEREWRAPGNHMEFKLEEALVILPGPKAVKDFMKHPKQIKHKFAERVKGIIPLAPVFF